MTQSAKSKPQRATRPPRPAPRAYASLGAHPAPTAADIKAKLEPLQQPPMTPEKADAVLAANGIPPAKANSSAQTESWSEAFWADLKIVRRGFELIGTAVIAVVTPLLTAAVDGLGVLVVGVTVWEGWRPATALADAFVAWCGSTF